MPAWSRLTKRNAEIRADYAAGATIAALMRKHELAQASIYRIIKSKSS